jgi:hypothetical protein
MHGFKRFTLIQKNNRPVFFILLVVLQCVIYGVGNPITKFAFESITPFWCLLSGLRLPR